MRNVILALSLLVVAAACPATAEERVMQPMPQFEAGASTETIRTRCDAWAHDNYASPVRRGIRDGLIVAVVAGALGYHFADAAGVTNPGDYAALAAVPAGVATGIGSGQNAATMRANAALWCMQVALGREAGSPAPTP
jgi:hypothetical protein